MTDAGDVKTGQPCIIIDPFDTPIGPFESSQEAAQWAVMTWGENSAAEPIALISPEEYLRISSAKSVTG